MPIYNFRKVGTEEIFELEMSMKEREEYLKDNPDIEQCLITPPRFADAASLGILKPPAAFSNRIRHMEKTIHGNNLSRGRWNKNITELVVLLTFLSYNLIPYILPNLWG